MASNADFSSSRVSSSSATEDACTPSKRAVYSSTAASPRLRTSARIAATRSSIDASVSADQCLSRSNSASKSDRVVSSWRRLSMAAEFLLGNGAREGVDQRAQRFALELQRGLVDHQARGDVHDAFHLDEVVR